MKLLLLLLFFAFYWTVFSMANRALATPPKRKNRKMNNKRSQSLTKNPLDRIPRRGLSLLHEDGISEDIANDGQNLGCSSGDKFYELGQSWHPDLGEPFGVLACTECSCSAITKKRRVIGKVICNNLASGCPKLHCLQVISIKGQCCNVCADVPTAEKRINSQTKIEKTQKMNHGEFMALLTGRFRSPPVQSDNLARAYITLNGKDLHFTVFYEKLDEQPSSIQILDGLDYLLFEKNLSSITNNKICGVWQSIPSIFASPKKLSQLLIVLSTKKHPEGLIGGHFIKHKTLNREVFSTLLKPNSLQTSRNFGSGGAAAFEVAKGGKNLKVLLWFNATFDKADIDSQVTIWLERNDGVRRKVDVAKVTTAKHSTAYHTIEMLINLHPTEKSHLVKGQLNLVVTSSEMSPTEFTGRISPKSTCDVFHAVSEIIDVEKLSNNVLGAASMTMNMNSNGTVTFEVKMIETSTEEESHLQRATFRLLKENPRNNKARTILSNEGVVESSSGMKIIHNVSINHMPLRDRDAFYKGKLHAEIDIEKYGIVKARIHRLPFREALAGNQALFVAPISISRLAPRSINENLKSPPIPLPMALFYNVENSDSYQKPCQFFYLLAVYDSSSSSSEDEKSFKLSLCQKNSRENCALLNFSSRESLIGGLDRSPGLLLIGRSDYLYSDQWAALRDGQAYFNLTWNNNQKQQSIVTGPITAAKTWCERSNRLQSDRLIAEDNRLLLASLKYRSDNPPMVTCHFEGVVYKDGEMFVSKKRSCTHCNCNRGTIACEKTICPKLNCDAASIVTVAGQCCPMCKSSFVNETKETSLSTKSCRWTDGQTYFVGETWYPYVAPFGFDKCALCTCGANLKVTCSRSICPSLSCPLIMRYREHATDCCAKCKNVTNDVKLPQRPSGLSSELSTGCFFNDRLYNDGAVFSPKLRQMATLKCIKCTCQNSKVKCRKETSTSSKNKISKYGAC